MSSNKTANLQLNQWAAGDAFLREEFNQDNGKIDAAVQGAKQAAQAAVDSSPYVKLFDVVTTTDTSYISLDMTGFDWSKYHELKVYAQMAGNSSYNCMVRVNSMSSGYRCRSNGDFVNGSTGLLVLPLGTDAGMLQFHIPCQCAYVGAYGHIIDSSGEPLSQSGCLDGNYRVALANVKTLSIGTESSSLVLKAGARVTVYGVKKR